MKQAVKEAALEWVIDHDNDGTSIGYRGLHAFEDGATWQKEQQSANYKQMILSMKDLMRYKHILISAAETLQYPDNYLQIIDNLESALSAALD